MLNLTEFKGAAVAQVEPASCYQKVAYFGHKHLLNAVNVNVNLSKFKVPVL